MPSGSTRPDSRNSAGGPNGQDAPDAPNGSDRRGGRPAVAVALPPHLRELFFVRRTWAALERLADVTVLADDLDHRDPDAYRELVAGKEIVVTGWGNPPLDADILAVTPKLRLLAHTAATVKPYVTAVSWAAGVRVVQAGQPMAEAVAEAALAHTLALLHRLHRFDHALRALGADWPAAKAAPARRELRDCPVGVVGASRCGRAYIGLVRALGADVCVYDPYLTSADAAALGVRSVGLDELMRNSKVVAVHAPVTDETRGLIGRRELALLPDEAIFVNTARAAVIDSAALLDELRSGRIDAGLDVHEPEPLPTDHPLRSLPNVLLTPHEAGGTLDARRRAGEVIVDELARFIDGVPLRHEVTEPMLARMG